MTSRFPDLGGPGDFSLEARKWFKELMSHPEDLPEEFRSWLLEEVRVKGLIDPFRIQGALKLGAVPESLPRGVVGVTSVATAQAGITSTVDVTGLSITFNGVAGRRYRFMAAAVMTAVTNTASGFIEIATSGNTRIGTVGTTPIVAVGDLPSAVALAYADIAADGSVTYKVRAGRVAGSGTITIQASSLTSTFIIEDIGLTP